MAVMMKKTTRKSRMTGSASKSRKVAKGLEPVRRVMTPEAPDRGDFVRDREAPDAGYGAPDEVETES